jgi:hypothetical protein
MLRRNPLLSHITRKRFALAVRIGGCWFVQASPNRIGSRG